jgi:predicted nucleotidyltransferase component of viral defense system
MGSVRERFEEAERGVGDWMAAAAAYAAHEEGRKVLLYELLPLARDLGDDERQANLHAALLRGEQLQAEAAEHAPSISKPTRVSNKRELDKHARLFGVAAAQVTRDHAISHALAAIANDPVAEHLIFYAGTALSRTLLPQLRLSEDIDLIATSSRAEVAEALASAITKALRRTHGDATWEPALTSTRGAESSSLRLRGGISIKVQLMRSDDLPPWPTEKRAIFQRYSDARPATLTVFTPAAFVGAKTSAWADRAAPRDLYDLWALGHLGLIDDQARDAYARCGGTGSDPQHWMFRDAPTEAAWQAALAHQGRVRIGPAEALRAVADYWALRAE